ARTRAAYSRAAARRHPDERSPGAWTAASILRPAHRALDGALPAGVERLASRRLDLRLEADAAGRGEGFDLAAVAGEADREARPRRGSASRPPGHVRPPDPHAP